MEMKPIDRAEVGVLSFVSLGCLDAGALHEKQEQEHDNCHQQAIQERQSQNKESPTFMWVHYLPPVLKSNLK